jgi:hypothetical protein
MAQQVDVGKADRASDLAPSAGPLAPRHGSALRWPMSKTSGARGRYRARI